jgi:capsular polysaccharide transport system ATP-binding protein
MIILDQVEKAYRTRHGMRNIIHPTSLQFYRGASTAILGLNGAGKSTMIRMLAQIDKPTRGKITRNVSVSWPLGLGGAFNGNMTGLENLRFVCRIYKRDLNEVIDFVRDFSELGSWFYEPIRTYSSGMRSRLSFGLSMAVDFQCYLIDEGLSVGDVSFKRKCRNIFEDRRSRADLILTSHSMSTVRQFCSRAVVIENGYVYPFEDLDAAEDFYMDVVARRG